MGRVVYFSHKLINLGAAVGGICILILGFIVTFEVAMRFLFKSPTIWVSDISSILCVASTFLTVGYALKEGAHVNVDVVTRRLSERNQIVFSLIGLLMLTLYSFFLTWKGAEVALSTLRAGETTPAGLAIPMVIPRSFIPIGGLLVIIASILQIKEKIMELRAAGVQQQTGSYIRIKENLPCLIFLVLLVLCLLMVASQNLVLLGIFVLLFVLIFSGIPIAFALGLLGLIGFYFILGGGPILDHIPMVSYGSISSFILVAIPLFIIVSTILSLGGVGGTLFEVANQWTRHLPGGMGVATIVACGVFAAISGSSTATVLTIGIIAIPAMISYGYERSFVYGTVAIGGVLGPLIPPSLYMIVIGAITGDSVGKLFMAGMLPGIMLIFIFCGYILLRFSRNKNSISKLTPVPWNERWKLLRKSVWGLLAPVIILGGIYSGIFTPTEAAAVGVTYSFFICACVYRTLPLKKIRQIIFDGAKLSSLILFIFASAMVFGQLVALLQIPEIVVTFLSKLPFTPMTILLLVLVFILILGALMDEASILLITYPILYQIFVKRFGFDSIWFALVFVFTLEVGLVAPPVALNLFVVQGIDKTAKFDEVVKGVYPFVILMILAIFIVVYFKPLSTWLPGLIG